MEFFSGLFSLRFSLNLVESTCLPSVPCVLLS